jgi:hypothetical protein
MAYPYRCAYIACFSGSRTPCRPRGNTTDRGGPFVYITRRHLDAGRIYRGSDKRLIVSDCLARSGITGLGMAQLSHL